MEQDLRVQETLAALAVDYVLTTTQVQRYYGLTNIESSNFTSKLRVFSHYLAATRQSQKYQQVNFVALKRNIKATKERAFTLRHYSGVADMRQQLNAPVQEWSLATNRKNKEEPDAFWYKGTTKQEASNKNIIAVEFDAGSYSPKQLKQKMMSFAVYQKQIWGSSSQKRVERIERLAKELGVPNFEVLYVCWCSCP